MGRKALIGLAHNICQIFLGYQIWDDLDELERLGSGALIIDVLRGRCTKDGSDIAPLKIGTKLRAWLGERVIANGLAIGDLESASLTVDYTVEEKGYWWRDRGSWWKWRHRPTWLFHFQCVCSIRAFGHDYSSAAEGEREFV